MKEGDKVSLSLHSRATVYDRYAISRRFTAQETAINIVQGHISLLVSESEIEELKNGNKTMYSKLATVELNLNSIILAVSSSEYKDINGVLSAITQARASIEVNSHQIELKVSKDSIVSSINQSAEAVKINANKIALTGNGLINILNTGTTTISATRINLNGIVTANENFKILADGSMRAKNATFSGIAISKSGDYEGVLDSGSLKVKYKDDVIGVISAEKWNGGVYYEELSGVFVGYGAEESSSRFLILGSHGLNESDLSNSIIIGGLGMKYRMGTGVQSEYRSPGWTTIAGFLDINGDLYVRGIESSGNYVYGSIWSGSIYVAGSGHVSADRFMFNSGTDVHAISRDLRNIYVGNVDHSLRLQGANCYANGGIIQTSDAKLKKAVEEIPKIYENLFSLLKPSIFKFKDGTSDRTHVGFIAQEVKDAICVSGLDTSDFAGYVEYRNSTESSNGEQICGLRYSEFISLNTMMIQKCIKRINDIEVHLLKIKNPL